MTDPMSHWRPEEGRQRGQMCATHEKEEATT